MAIISSPAALKARPSATRAKTALVDIRDEFVAVQEPSGPCATKTVIFSRGERLTNAYKCELAERHGVPLRWE